MFIHSRSSAPYMFAKFGWKTQTFCHKKVAKVIAKLESDLRAVDREWALCMRHQISLPRQPI